MNETSKRAAAAVIAGGVIVLMAGCWTTGATTASGGGTDEQAVMCSKCQTVWVHRPHLTGKSPVTFRAEKQTVCPDCQSAAVTFFKTGKLKHMCNSCGGTLDHCEAQQEAVTPQGPSPTASAVQQEQAIMCTKCKMAWILKPHQIGKTTVYRRQQAMECPDCKSAVANFFTTGKWQHTCATCGENLSQCPACR